MNPSETSVAKWIALAILVVVALATIISSFGTVAATEEGVKTRFNAVIGTVEPGLYFKIPYIDKVRKIDVKTQTIKYEMEEALFAASEDLQDVKISTVVNYHIPRSEVGIIYSQYGTTEKYGADVVRPIVRDLVKAVASKYTAAELVTMREDYNTSVLKALTEMLEEKHVVVERVNITNFQLSEKFTTAIENKVTAIQDAEAAKNKLEQTKYEKEQRIEQAKGEAEAIRIQAQAINSQGGADYVSLQWIAAWKAGGSQVPDYIAGATGNQFLMQLK